MYINDNLMLKFGITSAIILQNFAFWININKKNNKNFVNDKYWTYQTIDSLKEKFPFINITKIRKTIQDLVDSNILIKDNHNKIKYDRTIWYTFVDDDFMNEIINSCSQNSSSSSEKEDLETLNKNNSSICSKSQMENQKTKTPTKQNEVAIQDLKTEKNKTEDEEAKSIILKTLKEFGISNSQIDKIINKRDLFFIQEKIEQIRFLLKNHPKKIRSKATYLYMSIMDEWIDPLYDTYKSEKQNRPSLSSAEKVAIAKKMIKDSSLNDISKLRTEITEKLMADKKVYDDKNLLETVTEAALISHFLAMIG